MGIKIGTSHFETLHAAVKYYQPYGTDSTAVLEKLESGEISIGAPAIQPGDRLAVEQGRYHIIEADPTLSPADQAIIDLLWSSMKRDREHKDRVQTGVGTKTKIGLAATVRRVVLEAYWAELPVNQYHCKQHHVMVCDICEDLKGRS